MAGADASFERLLARLNGAWEELLRSIGGLTDAELVEPGALGEWSVKDVLAHIATWEEEALHHLPTVVAGGRPPKYKRFGGIDAFNAMKYEEHRAASLADVRARSEATHAELVAYLRSLPPGALGSETRARRRLRLDTYGHYALHTEAIQAWRGQSLTP